MIKLLCLGDAHLGRYPSRVPTDNPALSVRAVWDRAVSEAIAQRVDAVILTGDMADNRNSYFEAYGPLRGGIDKLGNSNIPVVAIAGNHDYAVFPQLVESISGGYFQFLGRDGKWDEVTLETSSGRPLRCVGWSFPSSHYDSSPLDDLVLTQSENFTIGIAHGDLDSQSKYAPLFKADMDAQPVDLWLLGHVHAPKLHEDSRVPILYPGSPQPLDPGETGVHGPWLITIDEQNHIQTKQLPLASVRYEEIPIDISDRVQVADIDMDVTEQVEQFGNELTRSHPRLRHLSCRLVLTGDTKLHRELSSEEFTGMDMFDAQINDCSISIDKVSLNTSPIRDLQEIAQLNNDPPGMLARWLLELESAENHPLLNHARSAAISVYKSAGFKNLGEKEPDKATLSDLTSQQAMLLLDELLAQKDNND